MTPRLAAAILGFGLLITSSAESLIPPLSEPEASEAAKIVEGFKTNPRGPFFRIRWFCNDGTDHPPSPYPCAERGGGRQHASLGPEARKLARWNVDVGVILAGKPHEWILDADRDHHLPKQLVLARRLEETSGGWIYRRAYFYRGARQIEDEEKAGRRFLSQLLSNPEWTRRRLFLAGQLAVALPHGQADSDVRRARNLATQIAGADSRFEPIRTKIHAFPDQHDAAAVEAFLRDRQPPEAAAGMLRELAGLLGSGGAAQRLAESLPAIRTAAGEGPLAENLHRLERAMTQRGRAAAYSAGAGASFEIARAITASTDGNRNLELLGFQALLHDYAFQNAPRLDGFSRRELLEGLIDELRYTFGAGLISSRQFEALEQERASLLAGRSHDSAAYFQSVRYLARSAEWSRATAAREFGPVVRHYEVFEPEARGLLDDLLRSSPALPLSRRLEILTADADQAVGLSSTLFGRKTGRASGLNPGRARGPLVVIHDQRDAESVLPNAICVIPQTVADLRPMAGILTLDSGNALSHTQLLAANLAIPNAVIPASLLPDIEEYAGEEVIYEVSLNGEVTLREAPPRDQEAEAKDTAVERISLDTSRLDLSRRGLVPISGLSSSDTGVIVGPKAANVGQLARLFSEFVAPGFAIPFGVFVGHIERPLGGDSVPFSRRIVEWLREAEDMRQRGAPHEAVTAAVYPRLAEIRERIRAMPLLPDFEAALEESLRSELGPDGAFGAFVRSDTNAEDLPQFTGAGLNLTAPNVVGTAKIKQAIRDVWASPYTERAYDWRSRILIDQEKVLPSILIMRTVKAEKSGVIATINLETGAPGELTVNVNEGVAAVVDGGVAESLLLKPDGSVRLLQQARGSYRKVAAEKGGFRLLPPAGDDHVLTPDEISQIRRMAAAVEARYAKADGPDGRPLPWDIEFGFENGRLQLFQIRPLVLAKTPEPPAGGAMVRLDEKP